ncbi:MAG: S10 family serine carboxypeptidase-like protein, partial [Phyllobacterium sp.]
ITLLDQTDLVFVDPVGTGYSEAIKPHRNDNFLSVMPDAEMVRDFVTSYVNRYNRQNSPKYLYGESYSGIRIPIAARMLVEAGTANFLANPAGGKPIVLSGLVLNSPILDYGANCDKNAAASCAGYQPTYDFVADYHQKSTARGQAGFSDYAGVARTFADTDFSTALQAYRQTTKDAFAATASGKRVLDRLQDLTGVAAANWQADLNMHPATFKRALMPGWNLGRYDARTKLPVGGSYLPDDFDSKAFPAALATLLPDFVNYRNKTTYTAGGISWNRDGWKSTTDLLQVLMLDPALKVLIVHGYHDTATPFHQSELDLKAALLQDRVPVKVFEGGHMIYYTEDSRAPLRKALEDFYRAPPYSYDPVTAGGPPSTLSQ